MAPPSPPGETEEAFSPAQIEEGRRLFAGPCTFLRGVADLDQLPPPGAPEVAFAGRSNVGKSSLINGLTGRKTLARTSNTPGRTQQLNFFDLGGVLRLVDLPGHGFAKVPPSVVAAWQERVDAFLRGRAPLRRVMLLVDSRHGFRKVDHTVMAMLDAAAVAYQVVLTKADKGRDLSRVLAAVRADLSSHVAAHPRLHVTSALEGQGLAALRAELAALATE